MAERDDASGSVRVAVRVHTRMLHPGAPVTGSVELAAPPSGARVGELTVAMRMVRRSAAREGAVHVEHAGVLGPVRLARDLALSPGERRAVDFTLDVPASLASSIPNQLDYEVVARADGAEDVARCLALPTRAGALPTIPVAPPWVEVGACCEAERGGRWHAAVIAEVRGDLALVAWSDGGTAQWRGLHQLREG